MLQQMNLFKKGHLNGMIIIDFANCEDMFSHRYIAESYFEGQFDR